MRRWMAVMVSVLLLLQLCACAEPAAQSDPVPETVRFYYCTLDYDASRETEQAELYGTANGAMAWEEQNFDSSFLNAGELLTRYLRGPVSKQLYCPIALKLDELHWSLEDKVLQVEFGSAVRSLKGVKKTVAAACLVLTMTQLPQVESVYAPELSEDILKASDFLLMDDTAFSDERELRLYFRDESGRYLRPETIRHLFEENESEPAYVLRQLIAGPKAANHRPVLPESVRLFWCRVDDGICTINLSEEFLSYMPQSHIEARSSVFAVVNTLTELPKIECVQFLCAGLRVGDYGGINLSVPLYREEPAILSSKEEQQSHDATLMVPCTGGERLLPVPMMVPNTEEERLAQDVLKALLEFRPMNGYENAIPEGTAATAVQVQDGLCRIEFNRNFAACDATPEKARQAVYSVVNTLCRLDGIDRVQISVAEESLTTVNLSEPLRPDPGMEHP